MTRTPDHTHLAAIHTDKGKPTATLDYFAILVSDTHGQYRRVAAFPDFFQDTQGQIFNHFLGKPKAGQCRIRQFVELKLFFFHILNDVIKLYSANIERFLI